MKVTIEIEDGKKDIPPGMTKDQQTFDRWKRALEQVTRRRLELRPEDTVRIVGKCSDWGNVIPDWQTGESADHEDAEHEYNPYNPSQGSHP